MGNTNVKVESQNRIEKNGVLELDSSNLENIFSVAEEVFEKPFEISFSINKKDKTELKKIPKEDLYEHIGKIGVDNITKIEIDIHNSYHPNFYNKYEIHKRIWITIYIKQKVIFSLYLEGKEIPEKMSEEILKKFKESVVINELTSNQDYEKSNFYYAKNYLGFDENVVNSIDSYLKQNNLAANFKIELESETTRKISSKEQLTAAIKEKNNDKIAAIKLEYTHQHDANPYIHCDITIPFVGNEKSKIWLITRGDEYINRIHDEIKDELLLILEKASTSDLTIIKSLTKYSLINLICDFPFKLNFKGSVAVIILFLLSYIIKEPIDLLIRKFLIGFIIFIIYSILTRYLVTNFISTTNHGSIKRNVLVIANKQESKTIDEGITGLNNNLGISLFTIISLLFIVAILIFVFNLNLVQITNIISVFKP